MSKKPKVLYISYDGMTDPLGQSQVLSYLKILSADFSFDVLSFEKPEALELKEDLVKGFIEGYDVRWIQMKYTKKPPILSTLLDLWKGKQKIKQLASQGSYDIVHCRGYILADLALYAQKVLKAKMIFDMRGWWPDEKVEAGVWSGAIYRPVYDYFKSLERKVFKLSDHGISLTFAGYDEIGKLKLKPLADCSVIPTCVDFKLFKPFDPAIRTSMRKQLKIDEEDKVILYSGSLGGNYSMALIFGLYKAMKKRTEKVKILLLTRTDKSFVEAEVMAAGVNMNDVRIATSDFPDVHKYLMAGDYGLVNYLKTYSTIGRSPTKLGEYWASGLPVVSESGIGDIDLLLNKYPESGVLVDDLNEQGYDMAASKLLQMTTTKDQLRSYSKDYYDIEKGASKYKGIYDSLLK